MQIFQRHEFRNNHEEWINLAKPVLDPDISSIFQETPDTTGIDVENCKAIRSEMRLALNALLKDKMMELRGQHPPKELSDKEIMERVLGRDSVYLRGRGRSPSVTTFTSHRENIVGNQPTYEELAERLNDTTSCLNATNEKLSVVVDILRHKNLMAPPPPPPTDQASDANLRESPSISVRESQDDS
ncbi:uncharacterized protein LOC133779525 [Humulus lupulus]|uniref:uncharacterized protein LOC133779525 n=1 Tax=Humulus lupulus TaxID=3486 RepID=UPI002B411284|nr:uncharacterized protein LOC133779525 [Humulus lupulus]